MSTNIPPPNEINTFSYSNNSLNTENDKKIYEIEQIPNTTIQGPSIEELFYTLDKQPKDILLNLYNNYTKAKQIGVPTIKQLRKQETEQITPASSLSQQLIQPNLFNHQSITPSDTQSQSHDTNNDDPTLENISNQAQKSSSPTLSIHSSSNYSNTSKWDLNHLFKYSSSTSSIHASSPHSSPSKKPAIPSSSPIATLPLQDLTDTITLPKPHQDTNLTPPSFEKDNYRSNNNKEILQQTTIDFAQTSTPATAIDSSSPKSTFPHNCDNNLTPSSPEKILECKKIQEHSYISSQSISGKDTQQDSPNTFYQPSEQFLKPTEEVFENMQTSFEAPNSETAIKPNEEVKIPVKEKDSTNKEKNLTNNNSPDNQIATDFIDFISSLQNSIPTFQEEDAKKFLDEFSNSLSNELTNPSSQLEDLNSNDYTKLLEEAMDSIFNNSDLKFPDN